MLRTSKLLVVLSMILAILIFVEVPIGAVAPVLSNDPVSQEPIFEDITELENESDSVIVSEIEGERTEFSKTFRLSDGASMVAQYTMPIHYKNGKGDWEDYDNSLSITEKEVSVLDPQSAVLGEATADSLAVTSESNTATITNNKRIEKKQMFKNRKSNADISFSKETSSENMVLVEKDGHTVSWGYKDIKTKSAKQKNEKKNRSGNDKFTVLDNLTSTVVYESAYDGVDIECITTPVGVKENIILNKKSATNKFVSTYDIGNLRAEKLNDREIALYNADDEIEYYINALYMYDANNETSEDIVLNILENTNGKLVVELVADEQWLGSSKRAYPVTIDPSFLYGQDWGDVQCTYIDSAHPGTSYGYGSTTGYTGTVYAGTYGVGNYRSLMKIESLPELNKGDMIINATVNLHIYSYGFYDNAYVGVYEAEDAWEQSEVTWNNQPKCSSLLIDYYDVYSTNTGSKWCEWNITKLVKKWYNSSENNNNGFYLKMVNESTNEQCVGFYSSNYPLTSGARPCFQIQYRNNKGLESHWNYTSVNVGNVGTAYINDYSGALTFELPIATTADPVLSANVSYIYNSYMAGDKYNKNAPYFGNGWRMNMQRTLLPSTDYGLEGDDAENFPYVYTDADGTEHYFTETTVDGETVLCDEDNEKLKLTVNSLNGGSKYVITDENLNELHFHHTGLFNKITDAYGNQQKVNYVNNTTIIEKISDSTGNNIAIERDESSNYVTSIFKQISEETNRITSFTYDSNNNLTSINYPNKNSQGEDIQDKDIKATISYNDDGLITEVVDVDGSKVQFGYNDLKQVVSVTEYGTSGSVGQTMTFDRTTLNETKVYTNGVDGVSNTADDCTTTYQFDNFGRTVSTQTSTNDGSELGASSATYTSGSNIKTINKVTDTHALGANAVNYILNSNLEGTSKWYNAAWLGEVTYTIGWGSTQKLYGQESFNINTTAYTGEGAGSIYQDVTTLAPKTTYTLSGYVKVGAISTSNAANYGALVGVGIYNSDGSIDNCFSECISEVTDTAINDGWRRVSVTFTTPENFTKVRVHLAMKSTIGLAYFDGIQLEKAENVSPYNMIQNGSMELYSNNQPTYWNNFSNINFSNSADGISAVAQHGSASFRIMGDVTKNKILYQEIPVSGTENDTYILSAWARTTTAVPIEGNIKFKITVQVWFSDGTYATKKTPSFNTAVTSWQYLSAAFNLSDETDTNKTPVAVKIFPNYSLQGNRAYFDNFQLIKEPAQSYTYDDEGNIVSVVDSAEQYSTLDYNSENLIESYTDPKGYTYTYEYNDKKNLSESHTQRGATYNYVYDSTRGYLKSVTGSTVAGHLTRTSTDIVYPTDDTSVYQIKNTDELHRTTTSTYDKYKGTLKSTTDGKGTISYTYNPGNDILTSVSQGGATVSYTYDSNYKNLEAITTGTSNYCFSYDEFGNRTETKVGNKTLATYTYGANNGPLLSMKYGSADGNGDTISYEYDKYGNEKERRINGTTVYKGIADNTGSVTKAIDHKNHLRYNYVYDSLGRLLSSTRTNTIDNSRVAMFEYDFDLNNNLTKFAVLTPKGSNVTSYEYGGDNLPNSATFSNGKTLTYTYDSLGRTKYTTVDTSTPIINNYTYCTYKYLDKEQNKEVVCRSNLIETEISDDFKYKYIYDERDNITEIQEVTGSGENEECTPIEKYTYDLLDQLVQVDYLTQKKRVKYTYDLGGNIVSEEIFTISGDTETLTKTNNYSYSSGEDVWRDMLISYNGQTIEYDAIGNPENYRNGFTFSWSNGRQLDTLTKGSTSAEYTYDDTGLRLSKTVNGVEYTYLYEGGLLVQETRGDMILDYSYDANGNLTMGAYRANESATPGYFYYALNSRGDVIGLYNSSGALIGKYTYDVWGNVTSITNASGVDVSHQNNMLTRQPFRYRSYYYDTESNFYYLQSRYYDPVTHRFINADGYVSTGTGILGHNMFAYCDNNPVNRYDPTGCSWLSNVWNSVKNFGEKAWNGIKTWAKNTFGAGSSTTATIAEIETPVIPDPSPITVKTGNQTTQTISQHGNSAKFISVYANKDAQHPIKSSSAGININIADFTLDLSVGLDDIGISGSLANGNTTNSFGVKLNLLELKVGLEGTTAIQWDNITETAYTNASVSGWAIAATYILVTTGQYVQSPSYAY